MQFSLAQVFPGMLWGVLMMVPAFAGLLIGVIAVCLRPKVHTRRVLAMRMSWAAIALSIFAIAGYMWGSEGDFTLCGCLMLASPLVPGAIALQRHWNAPAEPRGFEVLPIEKNADHELPRR